MRTLYELGQIRLVVDTEKEYECRYWLGSRKYGMYLTPDDLADIYELLDAYIAEFEEEEVDSGRKGRVSRLWKQLFSRD